MLLPLSDSPEIEGLGYGLGWVIDKYRGHKRIWHDGGIDGFTTTIVMIPEEKIGIIVLANMDETPLPHTLSNEITDHMLKLSSHDWDGETTARWKTLEESRKEERANKEMLRKTGTLPSHPIQDYVGEYEHPGYGALTVGLKGDALEMTYNHITTTLTHWHYDVFATNPESTADQVHAGLRILFQNDLAGDIWRAEIPMEPSVPNIVFVRKPLPELCTPTYLHQFAGTYELQKRPVTIVVDGSSLKITKDGECIDELLPKTKNAFVVKKTPSLHVKFRLNNSWMKDIHYMRQ